MKIDWKYQNGSNVPEEKRNPPYRVSTCCKIDPIWEE